MFVHSVITRVIPENFFVIRLGMKFPTLNSKMGYIGLMAYLVELIRQNTSKLKTLNLKIFYKICLFNGFNLAKKIYDTVIIVKFTKSGQ